MKTPLLLVAMTLVLGVSSQESNSEENKEKKIEIIKIIDGDTVLHKVTKVSDMDGPGADQRGKMMRMEEHRQMMDDEMEGLSEEIDAIMKEMNIYINVDDMHKKMIIRRMASGGEMEEIVQSLEGDDDILIDFEDGHRKMKVMKIQIDDNELEEITTIEMGPGQGKKNQNGIKKGGNGIKVFPNPASDEVNLEFEVLEGNAEVSVRDMDGKVIFEKSYAEKGKYTEKVKLKNSSNELLIIQLKEEGRIERKKIMVK